MVPAKTKRSRIHQYLLRKIHKWGFKNFIRAGTYGIIYNFFCYTGQKSAGQEKCGASEAVLQLVEELPKNQNFQLFIVVLRLVQELPKNQNFQLFMDHWFSLLLLLSERKTMEILSIATFCPNCLGGCPLMS